MPARTALTLLTGSCVPDSELGLAQALRELEDLKAEAAAVQAELAVALDRAVRDRETTAGVAAALQGRGVAGEVAIARRDSPRRGAQHLGLAKALVGEMPHTLAALRCGILSEWRATLLVRETTCLSREHRTAVDEALCEDPARLEGWGDRRLVAEARRISYRLDPHSVVDRARRAEGERHVSLRPAPDTMSYLTLLLPVAQGVACLAALGRLADAAVGTGESGGRSRGQVMADLAVERLTGQAEATAVSVTVNVTLSDTTLLAAGDDPAWLEGHGAVPAAFARRLVAGAQGEARAALRRLYARPADGTLVAVESTARIFPAGLARLIELRDQTCRTPWCDAPIRHHDHVEAWQDGGATSAANGQGLCAQCNHAKQAAGSRSRAGGAGDDPHTVETTTPAGQIVTSVAPGLPPPARPRRPSTFEFPVDLMWPLAS